MHPLFIRAEQGDNEILDQIKQGVAAVLDAEDQAAAEYGSEAVLEQVLFFLSFFLFFASLFSYKIFKIWIGARERTRTRARKRARNRD